MFYCKHCKKNSAIKRGVQKNKSGWIPRYSCTICGRWFVDRKGFEKFRHSPEVITAALDLRARGMSLKDVKEHLNQHHRVRVSRQTILDWQNKFGKKLKCFTQSLIPHLGNVFHADEMFIKKRKEWIYYWDCIDYETKFLIADHVSDDRNDKEAVDFLNKIKLGSPKIPNEIHTDNSFDYPPAFRKVFPRKRIHKHYPAWKKKFKNNPIERFHNTLKQRYKVFRNFHNKQGAENFFDFYRVFYNYVRNHMTLGEITPSEAAKIEIKLGRNKIRSLIERFKLVFGECHCI